MKASLIGVIHLPPLAGSPRAFGEHPAATMHAAGLQAVREAQLLEKAGFDGVILENFGDIPFYKSQVPPETIASMSVIAAAVRESTRMSIGINILRNDARSAMAVAAVTGCDFIRVNVLSGVAATDQGVIEGEAALLQREKLRLGAEDLSIIADIHVKHGKMLSSDDIGLAVEEAALRGMADAVIVTGSTTGRSVSMTDLARAAEVAHPRRIPLLIGSGATRDNLADLLELATGIIVGSDLRKGGKAGAPLDPRRVRELAKEFWRLKRPRRKISRR